MSGLASYPLSVIIITRNEEHNITDCLQSVKWANDLIVVDAQSSDKTVERARALTEKVFVVAWRGYGEAKNYALQHTQHDWILWLDADERVTTELTNEIQMLLDSPNKQYEAYEVARRAYFIGKWIQHCGWYPGYVVRLFRKDKVKFSTSRVHEKLEFRVEKGRLSQDLLHYTDENLFYYFSKLNRYTSLAAVDLNEQRRKFSLTDLLIKPPFLFVKMYILRRGFLDGMHGLVLSLLSAAYVFIKYAKLWERSRGSTSSTHGKA